MTRPIPRRPAIDRIPQPHHTTDWLLPTIALAVLNPPREGPS